MKKSEVLSPLEELFRNQLPNILMGMRLSDKVEFFPEPTEEELKLQWVLNLSQGYDFSRSRAQYKKWLLLKGFGEIHRAISESLKNLLVNKIIEKNGCVSVQQIKKIRKLSYPELVTDAQSICGKNLLHGAEILSLNDIRNALEHDGGIVLSSRIKSGENKLIIFGIKPLLFFQDGDNKVLMELGKPSPENSALMMGAEKFQIEFSLNDTVELSLKQFIDMVFTCLFIKADIEVMLASEMMLESV